MKASHMRHRSSSRVTAVLRSGKRENATGTQNAIGRGARSEAIKCWKSCLRLAGKYWKRLGSGQVKTMAVEVL